MRALVVSSLVLVAGAARAESPHEAPLASLIAGVASAMVPLAVGGGIAASASVDDTGTRRIGLHIVAAGFAVAPFVSHFVAREWKRGLVFGALPLICSVSAITILELQPDTLDLGTPAARIAYGALLAGAIVFSTAGLIDSFMLGVRGRPFAPKPRPSVVSEANESEGVPNPRRGRSVAFAPYFSTSGGGFALGGRF